MVRSMFSGVAGMKSHQTRLDVIGNNIANVNTYGFKSSRTTFRDVYYQSLRGAAEGTGNKGGLNPSTVGYGSTIGSVDVLQTQSALSTTGNPLDVAITGEGFFQVQDNDGNIFYTKAGMLNIDSNGNLIDSNGYFVLGVSGNPLGQAPASQRIQFSIPAVDPAAAKGSQPANNITYTIEAANNTKDGNVSVTLLPSDEMPIGQKCEAIVNSSGIVVYLNSKEVFANLSELETAMNDAITEANNGAEHPAGKFSITMEPAGKFVNLTGAEICGKNFGIKKGTVSLPKNCMGGFNVNKVGDAFSGEGATTFDIAHNKEGTPVPPATTGTPESFDLKVTIGGVDYTANLKASQMTTAGSIVLRSTAAGADPKDTITLDYPSYAGLQTGAVQNADPYDDADETADEIPPGYTVGQTGPQFTGGTYTFTQVAGTADATKSEPSKELGMGSNPFVLKGGTEGGPQTVANLNGISIGADGVITGNHPIHGALELGRIDLANVENPQGMEQAGNTYFTSSKNSGDVTLAQPGTEGTGALKSSALEFSNVDLSQEFSDMITTQRGFQANSRIITVTDTMLEELINLKR